jgi:hypothetical protein
VPRDDAHDRALGSRVPLHASGVGKAIFAALPDEQIEAIVKVKGLPRITENTITAPETMWASLRVIRQRGFSFDDEEHLSARAASPRRSTTSTPRSGRDLARGAGLAPARFAHQAARADRRPHRRGHHEGSSAGAGRIRISAAARREAMTLIVARAPEAPAPLWRARLRLVARAVKHVLPPTIFFFFGFNLILFTRWMTLEEHGIPFTNFFARRSPRCWSARRCWWSTTCASCAASTVRR